MNRLRLIAAVSGIYDALVGAVMLLGRPLLVRLFDVPAPQPPIHADLNGIFLIAVAAGYLIPFRDPDRGRGYLWVMGPLLKGGGALAFVLDYVVRHSPRSFLLFAASDGTLALITLWALLTVGASTSTTESPRP
ncbi:MAG: hypothetical protein DMF91_01930 [Acidobacteria bacterium]|nr:MAG: hypothetical protein DMF91_01930 [Acidobacteriota bacterium]